MSNSSIGIDVKARADFTDVERSAAKAARNFSAQFGPGAPAGRAAGGLSQNFKTAARDVADLERRLQSLHRTAAGLDLLNRVKRSGQDPNRPGAWDWNRLGYGSGAARDAVRGRFNAGWDHPAMGGAAPAQPRTGPSAAGTIAERFASGASGTPVGSFMGSKIGVPAAVAAFAAFAVGSKIKAGLEAGYQEHLKVLESLDGSYKSMSDTRGFEALMEASRNLSNTLDLTSEAGAKLLSTYQHQSGAIDSGVTGRATAAGALGRGLGLDPNTSAGLLARSELVGIGKNQQREFAGMLAHGIAQSGMGGRAEQYLETMVGHIEAMAQGQARTVSGGEIGRYNELMGGLFSNPALRGGGAQTIYGSLKAQGSDGGMLQEAYQWLAFGEAAGQDMATVKLYSGLEPHQSPFDVLGYGSKRTRMDLTRTASDKMAQSMPGMTAEMREALLEQQMYGTPMPVTIARRRQMDAVGGAGIDYGAFSSWVKSATGMGMDEINPAGAGVLAKLYKGRDDNVSDHAKVLRAMAKDYAGSDAIPKDMKEKLGTALYEGDIGALQAILPRVVALVGQQATDADKNRDSAASLSVSLERLGGEFLELAMATRAFKDSLTQGAQAFVDKMKSITDELLVQPGGPKTMDDVVEAISRRSEGQADAVGSWIGDKIGSALGVDPAIKKVGFPDNVDVRTGAKLEGVDQSLLESVKLAALANPNLRVQIISGKNPRRTGTPNHPSGKAIDVALFDRQTGEKYPNQGWGPGKTTDGEAARVYEKFWQDASALGDKPIRWGGYFMEKRNPMDAMHGDVAGGRLSGGDLVTGATPAWSKRFGGFSQPMIGGSRQTHRDALLKGDPALQAEYEKSRGILKYHSGGLVRPVFGFGADVPAVLKVGEEVLTDQDPRHRKNLPPATPGRMSPENAINARWQGALEMNVVFRDARGNVVQQRNALAVSEPRLPGSGPAQRFAWTDSVIMPA